MSIERALWNRLNSTEQLVLTRFKKPVKWDCAKDIHKEWKLLSYPRFTCLINRLLWDCVLVETINYNGNRRERWIELDTRFVEFVFPSKRVKS